jgi:hypothetical protein
MDLPPHLNLALRCYLLVQSFCIFFINVGKESLVEIWKAQASPIKS